MSYDLGAGSFRLGRYGNEYIGKGLTEEPKNDSELCIALASALHYVRLCVFSWMLLMTHNMYMQYKTGLHLVPITDTNISRNFISYNILWLTTIFVTFQHIIFLYTCLSLNYQSKPGIISVKPVKLTKNSGSYMNMIEQPKTIPAVTKLYNPASVLIVALYKAVYPIELNGFKTFEPMLKADRIFATSSSCTSLEIRDLIRAPWPYEGKFKIAPVKLI
ncbi:hypothetical protein HUJ04_002825 [Dendroctonus ponderosae]|nr:hypothetical protein HUJ04_002825 [Dendroctonus ponderosae]